MRFRSRARRLRRRSPLLRRLWRGIWRLLAVLVLVSVVIVGALRFVDPPVTAFMMQARLAAWADGETLTVQQRWVDGVCIADSLRLAVIAAEDQRFPAHSGFDVAQIVDALEQAGQGGRLRGASTLSQQTVKNLFLWPGQSWVRKGLEAGLTVLAEVVWPKARILELYLNVAEFGAGLYGAEAAARHYFGNAAADLTPAESALLAAVLPNPKLLRVDAPSDYVRARQRWILAQMQQVAGLPGVAGLIRQQRSGRCRSPVT